MTDRKMWKTGLSFGAVSLAKLQRAARAGLNLVEINGIDDPENWSKVPQWEQETGVKVWSFHLPFKKVGRPDDPDELWNEVFPRHAEYIARCGEAGIKHMVIHSSGESKELWVPGTREIRMQRAIERLNALSDLCKKSGTVLCVEVLPRVCIGNCSDEILRIMASNPDLRVCFDVNHLLKEDHVTFVKKVAPYIVTTHISDYDFKDECHMLPMRGQINWRELQTVLELENYKGPFLYEGLGLGYTMEDVRPNHEYLKNL